MGVNITTVINHGLNKKEILDLPSKIDTWFEIENLIRSEIPKIISQEYVDENYSKLKRAYFDNGIGYAENESILDEKLLEMIWSRSEEDYYGAISTVSIVTYFADISINRKTIEVNLNPWNRYYLLQRAEMAKFIIRINRVIAKKLNQNKTLYFPDSMFPTQILNDFIYDGKTVEEIIEIGDTLFTKRPKEIEEGIDYYYFVDDFSDDLSKL